MASAPSIPPEAVSWLLGDRRLDVLLIGGHGGYLEPLLAAGHAVTVIDPDIRTLVALRRRWPQAHVVSAHTSDLPFDPQCFSAVLAIQNFHLLDPAPTLREWARVLRTDGVVALAYFTRDDSVPWVKKLKSIIHSRLPDAMRGDYGVESVAAVEDSAYIQLLTTKTFRIWTPSTREELLETTRHARGADQLTTEDCHAMLAEVNALYDAYARAPEPLQLPFQMTCWRGYVDRNDLTQAYRPNDDSMTITF